MVASDVRVVLDQAEIARLAASPQMGAVLVATSQPGVSRAKAAAPVLTGAGAGSIHAEPVLDGADWTARVSWDQLYYYMRFHETGTRYMPADPFLAPAFD